MAFPRPNLTFPSVEKNSAQSVVSGGIATAQNYASTAVSSTDAFLADLQTRATSLVNLTGVTATLTAPTLAPGVYSAPIAPTMSTVTFNAGTAPVTPTLAAINDLEVGTLPTFTAALPTLSFGTAPAPFTGAAPTAPTLGAVNIPSAPTVALPAVPTLQDIVVPAAPLLSLPVFSAVAPTAPNGPDYNFSFAEPTYTSSLLTAMKDRLLEWVNGAATGLSPAVEQALWNRGRDREQKTFARRAKEAIRNFAARGFSKPSGALQTELAEAGYEAAAAVSTINRDITIEQAKLEQENRKFAFEQAFQVESMLVNYQNLVAQRAFDVAKYAQQVGLEIYQALVDKYGKDIQLFATTVEAHKTKLQSELAKLEAFKAQIEAQALIGEINRSHVEIYEKQIAAAKLTVDIFRTRVEAANTQAQVNKTQIESYAEQVGAYAEQVRAKAAEYDGYATSVKAELSKQEGYKLQSEAFSSQADAFKSLVAARVAAKEVEIKLNREVPLDLFKLHMDRYRTELEAESARTGVDLKTLEQRIALYETQVRNEAARTDAATKGFAAQASYNMDEGTLKLDAAKTNIQYAADKIKYLIEMAKAGSQVKAQLAASSLSAINLSGSLSDSYGYGITHSFGASQSLSDSFQSGDSISRQDSTSTNTSNSTNYNYAGTV